MEYRAKSKPASANLAAHRFCQVMRLQPNSATMLLPHTQKSATSNFDAPGSAAPECTDSSVSYTHLRAHETGAYL
eukprot:9259183-Pyramimonas_sp.AAC.1